MRLFRRKPDMREALEALDKVSRIIGDSAREFRMFYIDRETAAEIANSEAPWTGQDRKRFLDYASGLPKELEMPNGAVLPLPEGWVPLHCLVLRAAPEYVRRGVWRCLPRLLDSARDWRDHDAVSLEWLLSHRADSGYVFVPTIHITSLDPGKDNPNWTEAETSPRNAVSLLAGTVAKDAVELRDRFGGVSFHLYTRGGNVAIHVGSDAPLDLEGARALARGFRLENGRRP